MRSILMLVALATTAHADKLTPEQCKTEAAAIGKFLADTPHETSPLFSRSFWLVKRTDLPAIPMPPDATVNADRRETGFQGHLAANRAQLVKLVKEYQRTSKTKPMRIYLRLSADLPWNRVVDIVEAARSTGYSELALLFEIDVPAAPPPRSKYDDDMAASKTYPPKPGQPRSGDVMRAVLDPCPPLGKLFGQLRGEGMDNNSRAKLVIDGVSPALVSCACATDLPSVRSLFWEVVVVKTAITVLVLDAKAGKEPLAFPPDTMWADASKQIAPGKSYTFTVK